MGAEKTPTAACSAWASTSARRAAPSPSSNGEQFVVDSFVGWPADLVARKVLQRDLLIGRDALENRTMLDLHRPLERGLLKEGSEHDVEAARELLRHLLSLVSPKNGKSQPVRAVVGVPAAAMRTNKQYLRNALKGVVDSLMIVSEPFAVAYGLNALVHTMIIDIGAGTTDFCVMKGRYPTDEDQRSLTIGGRLHRRTAAEARFRPAIRRRASPSSWCASGRSKHSFVGEAPEPVIVSAPVNGVPTRIDITAEMRAACESIVPPIVETMLDLLSRVEPEFQERVRKNIILAGGGALIRNLGPTLEPALERSAAARSRSSKPGVRRLRRRSGDRAETPRTATGTGW